MEFSSDVEMRKIPELTQELFRHVLFDEEPVFVGDEATIWDVSMAAPEDLIERCSKYYGLSVSREHLAQPLWKLLRQLDERRRQN